MRLALSGPLALLNICEGDRAACIEVNRFGRLLMRVAELHDDKSSSRRFGGREHEATWNYAAQKRDPDNQKHRKRAKHHASLFRLQVHAYDLI